MRVLSWLVPALAGCGRVGFEPNALGVTDAAVDALAVADLPGLVARFSFETAPTPTFVDSISGLTGVCATPVGACPAVVPGHRGNGYSFDGIGTCLAVTDAPVLHQPLLTIALWANTQTAQTNPSLVGKAFGAGVLDSWQLETDVTNRLSFTTAGASADFLFSANNTIALGTWQHLAATFDGATKRLYIDGQLAGSSALATPIGYDGGDVGIGCDNNSGVFNHMLAGIVDEFEVYDRALSAGEITTLAAR